MIKQFVYAFKIDINASVVRTRISSAFLVIFSRRMADLVTRSQFNEMYRGLTFLLCKCQLFWQDWINKRKFQEYPSSSYNKLFLRLILEYFIGFQYVKTILVREFNLIQKKINLNFKTFIDFIHPFLTEVDKINCEEVKMSDLFKVFFSSLL